MTDKYIKLTRLYIGGPIFLKRNLAPSSRPSTMVSTSFGSLCKGEALEPTTTRGARRDDPEFVDAQVIDDVPEQDMSEKDFFDAEEYLESFSALGTSIAQGRDLKKKRKALDEYRKTLNTLREAYEDRVNIAQNYDAMITDQEHIIAATNTDIQRATQAREDIERKIADANDELAELKRRQAKERKPLEEELDLRNAELASAKDELKQVKAQRDSLDLFEDDSPAAAHTEAAHDAVVDKVNNKLEAAKAAQRSAQKALDAREKEERSKQKRALDGIKHLNGEKDKAGKRIEELEKRLGAARERVAFCAHVIEHPEETQAMAARIAENEQTAAAMEAQVSSLESKHAVSKAASGKARAVVIVAGIAFLIFIIFLVVISNR